MGINSDDAQITIFDAVEQGAIDNGTNERKPRRLQKQHIAQRAVSRAQRVGQLMNRDDPKSPTLTEAVRLAGALNLSLEEMPDRGGPLFPFEHDGLRWRLSGVARGTEARARRIAVAHLLAREEFDQVRGAVEAVYRAHGLSAPLLDGPSLHDLVQGGLAMGLAQFEAPQGGAAAAFEAPGLADELASALEHDPKALRPDGSKRRPRVRVVRNVAHESFALDPVAPFLIARVAHEIVARHLFENRTTYSIGLAGGMHCSTFVGSTGAESSPFPDDSGDKKITFVPLTLEPFWSHALPMADAVVGQMVVKARSLLGGRRIDGLTLQSFGYVVDERVSRLDDHVITRVREQYRDLDVAIFGCGDLESDGWLERVMRRVRIDDGVVPATDVCLNLLDEEGRSIPLPDGRQFVGISLADIRRLVRAPEGLALLLTSGRTKGWPIVVASRAGCADTIVCDEAAARTALDALAHGQGHESDSRSRDPDCTRI